MPFGLTADEFKQRASRAKDATVSTVSLSANRLKSAPASKAKWGLGPPSQPPPPPVKKTRPGLAFPPPPNRRASQSTNYDQQGDEGEGEGDGEPGPGPSLGRPPVMPLRASRPAIGPVQGGEVHHPSSSSSSSSSPLPPPPSRTRSTGPPPAIAPRRAATVDRRDRDDDNGLDSIDWANLSREDKEVFFSWLDEFFSRHLNLNLSPKAVSSNMRAQATPTPALVKPAMRPNVLAIGGVPPSEPTRGPPPKVSKWSKPQVSSAIADSNDFVMSHPPATKTGSAAQDFAQYFLPSTYWDSPWYTSNNPTPQLLQGNKHVTYATSRRSSGPHVTICSGVAFSDLSVCWYTVDFSTNASQDPNNSKVVKRSAQYLGRPRALDKPALVEAHETYGETIAAFAESFVGTGEYCARGECWDLADQALKYFDDFDYVPKPVPSLSRTHGHLIFEGKSEGKGKTMGRWRGGDDRVRRGDIVEWRSVKINIVGARAGSWAMLGEPDHTAVIVKDSEPSRVPVNGGALSPAELGSLEVVEQSVGSPPDRKAYDLTAMEKGEMWIYRPIGLQAYVGTLFGATCPPGVRATEI